MDRKGYTINKTNKWVLHQIKPELPIEAKMKTEAILITFSEDKIHWKAQ